MAVATVEWLFGEKGIGLDDLDSYLSLFRPGREGRGRTSRR